MFGATSSPLPPCAKTGAAINTRNTASTSKPSALRIEFIAVPPPFTRYSFCPADGLNQTCRGEERRGPRKRAALPGVGGCAEGPPRLGLHQPNLASKFAAEPGGSLAPKFAAEPGRSLAPDLAAVAD